MRTMPAYKSLCQAVGIRVSFSQGISFFCLVPYFCVNTQALVLPRICLACLWSWQQQSASTADSSNLQLGNCNVRSAPASRWLHVLKRCRCACAESCRKQHGPLEAVGLRGQLIATSPRQDVAFTDHRCSGKALKWPRCWTLMKCIVVKEGDPVAIAVMKYYPGFYFWGAKTTLEASAWGYFVVVCFKLALRAFLPKWGTGRGLYFLTGTLVQSTSLAEM